MSSEPDFALVAATLRGELLAHFAGRRERRLGDPAAVERTVATNSDLVPDRGRPLVRMLAGAGLSSLAGARILDVGCGFGGLAAYLAAHGAHVSGIDANSDRFSVGRTAAEMHGLDLLLWHGRMQELEPADEPFDAALMNNTLCYLVEPAERRAALEGVRASLRPGGLLLIRELNGWHPLDQFTRIPLLPMLDPATALRIARRLDRRRPLVRIVSPRALQREVGRSGYRETERLSDSQGLITRVTRNLARYQHLLARC